MSLYIINYINENIQQFRNMKRVDIIHKVLMYFDYIVEYDDIESYLTNSHIGFYPSDYEAMDNSVELNKFIEDNASKFNSMQRSDVAKSIADHNINIYKQNIMRYLDMKNIGISQEYITINELPKVKEFIENNIQNFNKMKRSDVATIISENTFDITFEDIMTYLDINKIGISSPKYINYLLRKVK